ncbi:MAG: 50S ribosomal protein L11 [Planctomycetaceae bacterium]
MAKSVVAQVKLQAKGGQATPAPPVGTALGPHGVNIGQFVSQFNDKTREMAGTVIPVIVTIYNDRSFEFILKSPPASVLLKQAAQIAKGSSRVKSEKVGTVTQQQLVDIAKMKINDLNAKDLNQASKMIAGTARSMGIEVVG